MAQIVIITHRYDGFAQRDYLLGRLANAWRAAGHSVVHATEPGHWPSGDVAILHVDLSLIPPAYAEASKHYARVINGAALDIRKRLVSRILLSPDDDWSGPVIVKTDLNCGGMPEKVIGEMAQAQRNLADIPVGEIVHTARPYPIFNTMHEVPAAMWSNPGLVVERFLPERDERGFWVRAWVFLGERERCTRLLGSQPVVKSGAIVAHQPVAVPEALRAERERLGFDYGKFDFVMSAGQAVLFDANRTPGTPPSGVVTDAANVEFARGIETWLKY
jgi:hypothetical protein